MVQRTLLNLLRLLLLLLLGTEHRWCEDPIVSVLFIIIIIIIILFKLNRIFEGLNMLEKSGNFAHASELVEMYVLYGFQK